jgi:hypothetical protein
MKLNFSTAAIVARLRNSVGAAIVGGTLAGSAAFAQTGGGDSMDVTAILATIAAVVVAENLVGPAWAGVKILKKAWSKIG